MTIITARFSSRAFKRSYCTHKNALNSQYIRSRFLDYFVKERDHTFIKSTPVAPYFDLSIPFINAGMCQVLYFLYYDSFFNIFITSLYFSLKEYSPVKKKLTVIKLPIHKNVFELVANIMI